MKKEANRVGAMDDDSNSQLTKSCIGTHPKQA